MMNMYTYSPPSVNERLSMRQSTGVEEHQEKILKKLNKLGMLIADRGRGSKEVGLSDGENKVDTPGKVAGADSGCRAAGGS